jgi:hypothetical protein
MPPKKDKKPKKQTTTQKRQLAKEAETADPTSKRHKNDSAPETPSRPPQNASQPESSPVRTVINFNGPIPEIPPQDLVNPETWELFSQVCVNLKALTRLMVGY